MQNDIQMGFQRSMFNQRQGRLYQDQQGTVNPYDSTCEAPELMCVTESDVSGAFCEVKHLACSVPGAQNSSSKSSSTQVIQGRQSYFVRGVGIDPICSESPRLAHFEHQHPCQDKQI